MNAGPLVSRATLRRLFLVALFVGLLAVFRHLLVLLVFFVAFERIIAAAAGQLETRLGLGRKVSLLSVVLLLLGAIAGGVAFGVSRAVREWLSLRHTAPDRIAAFRETPLFQRIQEHVDADSLVEGAKHYASNAVEFLSTFGHVLLYMLIGLILAVVFLLEKHELDGFAAGVDRTSIAGTLLRWLGYLADAVSVTLQFQLVVAAFNAALTLPVLLLVGIPHVVAFVFMIFVSGLVPVVGNFAAGGVLTLLAYQAHGWLGVGVFVTLTFILHKVESYYLNPRLASRHVHLPGFVLIISLLLWEHLLGFVGLFVSFPILYIAAKIRKEFLVEDETSSATGPTPPTH